jgi:hypothetical protein
MGIGDHHDRLADHQIAGPGQADRLEQPPGRDLHEGQVLVVKHGHELGRDRLSVGQHDHVGKRLFDPVGVRDQVARLVDHEAGADAGLLRLRITDHKEFRERLLFALDDRTRDKGYRFFPVFEDFDDAVPTQGPGVGRDLGGRRRREGDAQRRER